MNKHIYQWIINIRLNIWLVSLCCMEDLIQWERLLITHEQTYIPVDHKYTAEHLVSLCCMEDLIQWEQLLTTHEQTYIPVDHKYTSDHLVSLCCLEDLIQWEQQLITHEQTYIPVDHKYTAEHLESEFMLHGRLNSMRTATHDSWTNKYLQVDHKYTAEHLVSDFMLNEGCYPLKLHEISHSYQLDQSISV